jgi:hypothetical protein
VNEGELTLVVLAAGLGSRFGGVKQLTAVGPDGATLMDYAVHDAWRAGFERAVFVIRPDLEADFEALIGRRYRGRFAVETAVQRMEALPAGVPLQSPRARPWGTTHAVLAARGQVRGNFAVLNADDFYGRDALARAGAFLKSVPPAEPEYAVVGYPMAQTASPAGGVNRAVLVATADGALSTLEEVQGLRQASDGRFRGRAGTFERVIDGSALVSMNLWAFTPRVFDGLEQQFRQFLSAGPPETAECYLPDAIARLIAAGQGSVRVLPTTSSWCGITYAEDRARVEAVLRDLVNRGEYPTPLWS